MKLKFKKKLSICFTFAMIFMFATSSLFAVGVPTTDSLTKVSNGAVVSGSTDVIDAAKGVWNTAATIIQILAVAAVVFAGVRYMFASADAKADIKKQTVILIIGAVLVFGATAILQLVSNATDAII